MSHRGFESFDTFLGIWKGLNMCKTVFMFRKEIKEDINKWKDFLCSRVGKLNVRMVMLPKLKYRSNTIPITVSITLFAEMESGY